MEKIITIVVPVYAKPGKAEALKELLVATADQTRLEAGNVCYRLHQAVNNENLFYLYEQWRDKAALDYHMSQPYHLELLEDKDELMARNIAGIVCKEII